MITATVLAVFFVPVFYVAIQSLIELKNGPPKPRPGQVIHAPLVDEPAVAPPAPDAGCVLSGHDSPFSEWRGREARGKERHAGKDQAE